MEKTCKTHQRRGCTSCKGRATTSDPYQDTALWLTTAIAGGYATDSSCDTSTYDGGSSSSPDCSGF